MRGLAYNQIQNGSSHTHKKRCSPLPHGQHLFFIPICYLLPYSFLKNAYPARSCPSIYCPIVFYPLPITHLRNKSTGIIVTASSTTAIQPIKLNGTQLNIFPIHSNTGIGINAAFTIAAYTNIIVKNTFKKPVFSLSPLKMPKPSSLTLKPLNNAPTINSTK